MTIFNYTLRYSKKAKHLQLQLSLCGLEVVVPVRKYLTNDVIEQFLQEKQSWIKKHWQQKNKILDNPSPIIQQQLPTSIHLNAINQKWNVVYLPTIQHKLTLVTNPTRQITLMGDVKNESLCLQKLRQWLRKTAQHHLSMQLTLLAWETDLPFNNITIRNNYTRWGSCSSQGNISLCCKLLFLPPPLMRHVLLHELCHTKIMHHGKKFWQLLAQFDKEIEAHVEQLKVAQVPIWAGR